MTAIQIRDVPDEARDVLAQRAKESGKSLNKYLRDVIIREAGFARNTKLVDDIATWPTGADFTADDVIDALDAGRAQ